MAWTLSYLFNRLYYLETLQAPLPHLTYMLPCKLDYYSMGYVSCPSVCEEVYLDSTGLHCSRLIWIALALTESAHGAWGGAWWRLTVCVVFNSYFPTCVKQWPRWCCCLPRQEREAVLTGHIGECVSWRRWWVENQPSRPWKLTCLLSSLLSGASITQGAYELLSQQGTVLSSSSYDS